MEKDPFDFKHYDIKRLHGKYEGQLRFRVGNLRVIYEIDATNRIVNIIAIRPRGQAY